jgi:hypothetical protein
LDWPEKVLPQIFERSLAQARRILRNACLRTTAHRCLLELSARTCSIKITSVGWDAEGELGAPLNVLYQRLLGPNATYNVTHDVVPNQPLWIADDNAAEGRVLNPRAFTRPAGVEGTFPRNSLRAFPVTQFDVALRRRFRITERLTLDARAELFNVLNHSDVFSPPASLWGTTGSGPLPFFG